MSETAKRAPSEPKGRPTPGRKQRNAEARRRARRDRWIVRLWWTAGAIVLLGALALAMTTGAGNGGLPG